MVIADETDFGAAEEHAATELVAEMIIKTGAAVGRNAGGSFGLFHAFIITHL